MAAGSTKRRNLSPRVSISIGMVSGPNVTHSAALHEMVAEIKSEAERSGSNGIQLIARRSTTIQRLMRLTTF